MPTPRLADPDLEPIERASRDELLRVAENLVENAIKYGGPNAVTIRAYRDKSWAVLDVEDQGPGIALEHVPRLTERFYRVDTQNSRAKGGTGLGLSISRSIVRAHGGKLWCSANPGGGARFFFTLPAVPAQAGSQQ